VRYLIYSYCFETPHFETELEIALKLKNEGHEVFFLVCKSDLKTCFVNPKHSKAICAVCRSKISNGLGVLGLPEENILRFTEVSIQPDIYKHALTSFEALSAYVYKDNDIGLAVVSSLVSDTRDHYFNVENYQDEIKVALETSIMVYENFDRILKTLRPDGVVMFNGRFLESRPAIKLCEKLKIDYFTHERGGQLDRYMFRENSNPHTLSYAKKEVVDMWKNGPDDKVEVGKKFYEERRNRIVHNWHVYTGAQVNGQLPSNFDATKRNFGIFNSSIDEYVTIPDFKSKLYADDNDGIAKVCESFLQYPEFHFYLRIHPNLKGLTTTQTIQIAEMGKKYKNLTIIPAEDKIDSYALMQAVEAVISFGSTTGVEALYWGVPSILLGRAYYEGIEGIVIPESHEEAVKVIISKKTIAPKFPSIKFGYWSLMYGTKFEYFKPDGLFKGTFLGKEVKPNLLSRIWRKIFVTFQTLKQT